MTLTIDQAPPSSNSLCRDVALILRCVGGPARGKAVALKPGKYALGSSRRCDVQLAGAGIRPLHCLLTVDDDAVKANRWAPGVLLNGCEFVESLLEVGDKLTLGSYEFELAADRPPNSRSLSAERPQPVAATPVAASQGERSAIPATHSATAAPAPHAPAAPPTALSRHSFEDRALTRLWTRNHANQARARKLADDVRKSRQAVEDRERHLAKLSAELSATQTAHELSNEEILRLRKALRDAESAAQATETSAAECRRLAEQLQRAEAHATELTEQITALETQLAEQAASLAAAADSQQALRSLEDLQAAERQELQSLRNEAQQARRDAAEARQDLQRYAQREQQLSTQLSVADAEKESLAAAVAQAEAALQAAEETAHAQRLQLDALQADVAQAICEAEKARDDARRHSLLATEIQARLDAAEAERAVNVPTATDSAADDVVVLQQVLADVQAERDAAVARAVQSDEQAAQLAAELEVVRENLLAAEGAVADYEALQSELNEAREALQAAQEAAAAHDATRRDLKELREKLLNTPAESADLDAAQRELAAVEAEYAAYQQRADAACHEAETRLQAAEQRASEAEAEQRVLGERLETLQGEIERLHRQRDEQLASPAPHSAVDDIATEAAESTGELSEDGLPASTDEAIAHLRAAAIWKDDDSSESAEVAPASQGPTPSGSERESAPSFIEQYRHLLDEDDEGATPVETVAPVPSAALDLGGQQAVADGCDDEAALQAYMDNMMRRMRGEPSASSEELGHSHKPASYAPSSPAARPAEQSHAQHAAPVAAAEPVDLIDMESLKRSTKKTDLPADIGAMRELANSSARHAIAKHHKKRLAEAAWGRFALGVIAIGLACYLMLSAEWIGTSDFMLGAGIAVVGAWATGTVVALVISELAELFRAARARSAAEAVIAEALEAGIGADDEMPND
ncbi:MAG: hypothetical protein KDA44_14295 [Planctomycetales bacterium]|nr:hypothetical protein [Planctomycetales bacterium]